MKTTLNNRGFSIFIKFAVIISLSLLVIFTVIGFVLTNLQEQALLAEKEINADTLTQQVAAISATPIKTFAFFVLDENTRKLQANPDILSVRIYDTSGKILNPSGIRHADITVSQRFWLQKEAPCIYTSATGKAEEVGKVVMTFSLESIYRKVTQMRFTFIIIIIATVVIVDAVVMIMVRIIITRPLNLLTLSAEQLSSGEFDIRQNYKANDEIGFLSDTFVKTSRKLKENFDTIKKYNESLHWEIDERKRAEQKLTEERNLLRILIDTLPNFIYVKDKESRFLIANDACIHSLQLNTLDELIGKTDFDLLPRELAEKFYNTEQALLQSGQSLIDQEETNVNLETGEPIWFLTTKVPFRDSQGNVAGIVGVSRDITERKQWEEELRRHRDHLEELVKERTAELTATNEHLQQEIAERARAEKELQRAKETAEAANQAKSEFLSNMSHELRTPLNGILGYTQILGRDKSLTSEQKQGLGIIHQSGEHLLTLINDILDLSKIEARKMDLYPHDFPFPNFLDSIAGMIRMRAQEQDIEFEYQTPTPLPLRVHADEKRLRQVLLNLLGNAVKFTDQGKVSLRVYELNESKTQKLKNSKTHTIRFEVIDTGIGMSPDQVEKIFQPFWQVADSRHRAAGTGLGLTISQQLVQAMGSKINLKSEAGRGTTFWFELDLPEVSQPSEIKSDKKQLIIGFKGEKHKILIVDDNPENLLVLRDMLIPLGFDVFEAVDGHEAFKKAQDSQPDLILMDLIMPGVNGFETIQHLRQLPEFQDTIIIAASADAFEDTKRASLESGGDGFLVKPIREQDLLELLDHHLHLEWIYEELPELPETGTPSKESPLISPPRKDLNEIYELVMIGDITGIRKRINELKKLDPKFIPFATKVCQFADTIQLEQLQAFLETHLEKEQ